MSRVLKMLIRIKQLLEKHQMNMSHVAGVYTLTDKAGTVELSTLDIRKVDAFLTEKC